jgi:hypothetical protein
MKQLSVFKRGFIFCLVLILLPLVSRAEEQLPEPDSYQPRFQKDVGKELYDDPTDLFVTRPFKNILPTALYDKITFDQEKMKKEWLRCWALPPLTLWGKLHPRSSRANIHARTWISTRDSRN